MDVYHQIGQPNHIHWPELKDRRQQIDQDFGEQRRCTVHVSSIGYRKHLFYAFVFLHLVELFG